ncbi:MAG: hypothetical protein QW376_08195 [Candidatus Caldarchaeum sp.]
MGGDVTIQQLASDLAKGGAIESQSGGNLTSGTYCYLLTAFIDDKEVIQGPRASQISVESGQQVVFRWQVAEELRQVAQFGGKAGYRIYRFGPLPADTQCTAVQLGQYRRLGELELPIPPPASLSFTDDGRRSFIGGAPQLKAGGNLSVAGNATVNLNLTVGALAQVGSLQVGAAPAAPGPGNAWIAGNLTVGALAQVGSLQVGVTPPPGAGNARIAGSLTVGALAQVGSLQVGVTPPPGANNAWINGSLFLGPKGWEWQPLPPGSLTLVEPFPAPIASVSRLEIAGPAGNFTLNLGNPTPPLGAGSRGQLTISDLGLGSGGINRLVLGAGGTDALITIGAPAIPASPPQQPQAVGATLGRFTITDLAAPITRFDISGNVVFNLGNKLIPAPLGGPAAMAILAASGSFTIKDLAVEEAVGDGKACAGANPRLQINEKGAVGLGVAPSGTAPAGALEIAHSLGVGAAAPAGCGDAVIMGKVGIGLDSPEAKLHILAKPDDPVGFRLTSQGAGRDAIFETTTDNDLDLMLEAANKTRFDLVTFKNGGFGIVDCGALPSIACVAFASTPANASLLVQAGQIKLYNFDGSKGQPTAIGVGAIYFDTAANPATGDPPNTPYFWDGKQWVPLRGLKCWDLNGNGRPDLPAEDANGDGKVDALDCKGPKGDKGDLGPQGPAGLNCWDLDGDGIQDPAEDRNGDGRWDAGDCQGPKGDKGDPGPQGLNCWDLDGDGIKDPGEDINGDGKWDTLDCKGPKGDPGGVDFTTTDKRYVLKPRDETDLTLRSLTTLMDLSAGRNLSVSGDTDLLGSLTIGGDLNLLGDVRGPLILRGTQQRWMVSPTVKNSPNDFCIALFDAAKRDFLCKLTVTPTGDVRIEEGSFSVIKDTKIGGSLSVAKFATLDQYLFADWLVVGEPGKGAELAWGIINPDKGPDLSIGPISDIASGQITPVLRLSRDGKVGISIDKPTEKLHVNGNVQIDGNLRVTKAKFFVQRHPDDPTKEILFAALEGPEVGVYLRGEAQLEEGQAIITLPKEFSVVTASEGLTVQLTPVGEWLQLYVVELSPQKLVVREAQGKSGKFFYLVQGVRKGFEGFQAVQEIQDRDTIDGQIEKQTCRGEICAP